jgi:hypothetical protein
MVAEPSMRATKERSIEQLPLPRPEPEEPEKKLPDGLGENR